jgi:hypothetical protein
MIMHWHNAHIWWNPSQKKLTLPRRNFLQQPITSFSMANSQSVHHPLVVATGAAATVNDFTAAQIGDTLRERLVDGLQHDQFYLFDRALAKGIKLRQMMLADSVTAGQMFTPPQANAESIFQSAELLSSFNYVEDLSAPNE